MAVLSFERKKTEPTKDFCRNYFLVASFFRTAVHYVTQVKFFKSIKSGKSTKEEVLVTHNSFKFTTALCSSSYIKLFLFINICLYCNHISQYSQGNYNWYKNNLLYTNLNSTNNGTWQFCHIPTTVILASVVPYTGRPNKTAW